MIRLRAIEPEDLDLLYRIENDADLWAVGTTNVPYSRYTLHDYIATFDPRHRRAEIGIVVEQPHRRKGYAREALEALHDYARRVIHLHQLYVIISIGNQPARQLFHSMGYRTTATLTDWLLLSDNTFSDAVVMQLQL